MGSKARRNACLSVLNTRIPVLVFCLDLCVLCVFVVNAFKKVQREDAKDSKRKAGVVMGLIPDRNACLSVLNTCIPVLNPVFPALNSAFLRIRSANSATPPSVSLCALRIFALNSSHSALLKITLR